MGGKTLIFLSALIVPVGFGVGLWDLMQRGTIESGQPCNRDAQCVKGKCLHFADAALCADTCADACEEGFGCVGLDTFFKNAGGMHDLGRVPWCLPQGIASALQQPSTVVASASDEPKAPALTEPEQATDSTQVIPVEEEKKHRRWKKKKQHRRHSYQGGSEKRKFEE